MRKISADYIFPVSSSPVKNGTVCIDDNGVVQDILSPVSGSPAPGSEVYPGILVPGFVNAHCHLELSHLKGEINEHKGLTGFIQELIPKRAGYSMDRIKSALIAAEDEMYRNGIVAVGDISNTDHSFEQKKKGRLSYYTFIEIFDLNADKAKTTFDAGLRLQTSVSGHPASITPHAPYTVSGKLMELIDNLKQPLLSVHNQETAGENELFRSGTGSLAEMMQDAGVDVDSRRRARSSLLFTLGGFLESKKLLLVHNTYTSKEDMEMLGHYTQGAGLEIVFCLCPRANLYIENRLPDIPMLFEAGAKLTIGTDSYASNRSLSILEEMKAISNHFPEISFETLVTWATKNGAEALGMENEIGTIEKGKKPGLNLIQGMDLQKIKLSDKVTVKRLV